MARREPSGLYASDHTPPGALRSLTSFLPSTSQILTNPSLLPAATRLPSGLKDTQLNAPPASLVIVSFLVLGSVDFFTVSTLNTANSLPVLSQSLTDPSAPAVAS